MQLSSEFKVGVTVVLSILLLASMGLAIGRIDFRKADGMELTVTYNTVDGLREGASVRFAGVTVGKVQSIRLQDSKVHVGLRIDQEMIIPQNSSFVIITAGILGDKHVEIQPGDAPLSLEASSVIVGVDPVMIDSILSEMETTLRSLNQAIVGFTEIADSQELKDSVIQSGVLMKETVLSLKETVDQVSAITYSVHDIIGQVGGFTAQLPDLHFVDIMNDIETFSSGLGALNFEQPITELTAFTQQLNAIPIGTLTADVQKFTDELSQLDLKGMEGDLRKVTRELTQLDIAGMESDLRQFTRMMASIDVEPMLAELASVTQELVSLDITARGQEIAGFTSSLAEFPLENLALDLQLITQSLREFPLEQIADNVLSLSQELADVPVSAMVSDLRSLTAQLTNLGWQEMANEVRGFTQQLAEVNVDTIVDELLKDFHIFTSKLAQIDVEAMFGDVEKTISNIADLATAVDGEAIARIVSNFEDSANNIHLASGGLGDFMTQLNVEVAQISAETSASIAQFQTVLAGLSETMDSINYFVDDLVDDGSLATSIKATLANVEKSTQQLSETLELIINEVPLTAETFEGFTDTMASIQKINEDIQTIRGMGEKVDVESRWALSYNLNNTPNIGGIGLSPDVRFDFVPEEEATFYVVGWNDLGGENFFQLQYGKESGNIRQRYGILDSSFGVGLDARISDQWSLTGELRDVISKEPMKLRLRGDYQWIPDWWLLFKTDNIFEQQESGFSLGVERRF